MIALDAKVKSDMRVAELEKRLEKAKQVADAKAKEAAGSQQLASAAASVKHVLCVQQDPRDILAPMTATASSTQTASAENGSRPSVLTTAQSVYLVNYWLNVGQIETSIKHVLSGSLL